MKCKNCGKEAEYTKEEYEEAEARQKQINDTFKKSLPALPKGYYCFDEADKRFEIMIDSTEVK